MDYGHKLKFGIFPVPNATDLEDLVDLVREADSLGLDLVGIQDHPYQRRFVDTFTLITALAVKTEHIRFFPDVASLPLRPPAILAKVAATIDLISSGRFELGLGAGAFWEAIGAIGGPRRSAGEAFQSLEEAIDIIRLMWSDERSVRYHGNHYQLGGVKPGPQPAHPIGIWLGVGGPRALNLLGRKADGWIPSIPSMPIETLNDRHDAIDQGAIEAGRDPSEIRRLANVNGVITTGNTEGFLRGPADQWIDQLSELALDHRIDSFILWPDGDPLRQTRLFADLVPAVEAAVAAGR